MADRRVGLLEFLGLTKRAAQTSRSSAAELAALQERELRATLRHAVASSPYHQRRFAGIDVERCALSELPTMTKRDMMENFDELVTDRELRYRDVRAFLDDHSTIGSLYRGRYVLMESSGSSGVTAAMVHDITELTRLFATFAGRQALARHPTSWQQTAAFLKGLFKKMRHASMLVMGGPMGTYITNLHAPGFVSLVLNNRIFDITTPFEELVQQLNEYQPQSIVCYASTLEALAHAQLTGALKVRFDQPTAAITSGGEPLTDAAKRLVRRAWNMEVEDVYGMTECISIARTCPTFGGMHLMSDLCILEIVDDDNRPVPAGQYGSKALLTNLYNRTQPLIRYEISDVVGYSAEPCTCGWAFPRLLPVKGRTYDRFYVARPSGGYEVLDMYRFGFLLLMNQLAQYQLVQTERNAITIRYIPLEPGTDLREEMEKGLASSRLESFDISFSIERVDVIEPNKASGKTSRMVSKVGPPTDSTFGVEG